MAADLLEQSRRILEGVDDIEQGNPFQPTNELCEVADGVAEVSSFANVAAFTTDDGLVLVDTGSPVTAQVVHRRIRSWSPQRLNTAVYTHGHIDHVFGTAVFDEESAANGWERPVVVAHQDVDPRFDRYCLTAGYNAVINQRQFRIPGLQWPTDYRRPDTTYVDRHDLVVGGLAVELHHARGETDDHTWVWVPERRTLCTGDLFIWCTPNAGNPQKVQRYARDWAVALRAMADLGAELLLPGHGLPIAGAAQVRQALVDTADLLDSLVDQTLALMNEGARLDEVVHAVQAPAHLLERPYLQPIYDEPEFIVHNLWRLYGGWYDGNPAHLKPAPDAQLAGELAELAGGAARLAERATELAAQGDLRLAGHLAELATQAAPDDPALHRVRADVFGQRARTERSLMARGVFSWAEAESSDKAGGSPG
jgi:alkyl sulfatase BDS1-like metallo-beta-lactamase superfamily hydrolase